MVTSRRMYCGLLVAGMMLAVHGFPTSDTVDPGTDISGPRRAQANIHTIHLKRPSTHDDKVLAIGVPMVMSKYVDYVPNDSQNRETSSLGRVEDENIPLPRTPSPWWGRSSYWYRSLLKCPKGERRDGSGVCRRPWGVDETNDYFSF